jgi:hypothetical protein
MQNMYSAVYAFSTFTNGLHPRMWVYLRKTSAGKELDARKESAQGKVNEPIRLDELATKGIQHVHTKT